MLNDAASEADQGGSFHRHLVSQSLTELKTEKQSAEVKADSAHRHSVGAIDAQCPKQFLRLKGRGQLRLVPRFRTPPPAANEKAWLHSRRNI